jgi:hypothetical protein
VTAEAFFRPKGELLEPRAHAHSPWSPDMLHGRLLAGLAAREVERAYGGDGFQVVRVTVDLFRAAPMAAVRVRSSLVRDGGRARGADVAIESGEHVVARATALLLRPSDPPPGSVWSAPAWTVPGPEELPGAVRGPDDGNPDLRPIGGPLVDAADRKCAWMRDGRDLVDGEALTPVARAVMAADVANPLSNWGDAGLHFINADVSVQLARLPQGEWIGLEVTDHLDAAGIAVGQCSLYDPVGRFGHATVSSVTRPRFAM